MYRLPATHQFLALLERLERLEQTIVNPAVTKRDLTTDERHELAGTYIAMDDSLEKMRPPNSRNGPYTHLTPEEKYRALNSKAAWYGLYAAKPDDDKTFNANVRKIHATPEADLKALHEDVT